MKMARAHMDPKKRKLLDKLTITVDEAGEILDIGRNSAYEAVRRGDIESFRTGKLIHVPTAPLRRKLGIDGVAA